MPSQEIDIRDGRQVSSTDGVDGDRGGRSSASGIIPVRLRAPRELEASIVVGSYPNACALFGGSARDEVRAGWEDGAWTLTWPEDLQQRGGQGTQYGNNNFQSNNFQSSVHIGNVHFSAGDSYAGGRHSRSHSPAPAEPSLLQLFLPSGCSLEAELTSGGLNILPPLSERHGIGSLTVRVMSADLHADCAVAQVVFQSMSGRAHLAGVTGPVQANTASGEVMVEHAMGDVVVSTMSGQADVHAESDIAVVASSMSGSISVTAAPGVRPRVNARTISGRIRKP
jgi:hypothetical protein